MPGRKKKKWIIKNKLKSSILKTTSFPVQVQQTSYVSIDISVDGVCNLVINLGPFTFDTYKLFLSQNMLMLFRCIFICIFSTTVQDL